MRTLLLAYAIALMLALVLEDRLVYSPARYPSGNWSTTGLDVEDVHLRTADGAPKEFFLIDGGGHYSPQPKGYFQRVRAFLARL